MATTLKSVGRGALERNSAGKRKDSFQCALPPNQVDASKPLSWKPIFSGLEFSLERRYLFRERQRLTANETLYFLNCRNRPSDGPEASSTADRIGARITTEDFDEGTMFLQLAEGALDQFLLAMTFDIDKEKVFPIFPFGGPALDFAHAQFKSIEWLNR